jgi:PAP2 superfamily protein
MFLSHLLRRAARPHSGRIELAALAALYGIYELVRGFGSENWAAAHAHTADIVALERNLHLFVERDVQSAAAGLIGVPTLLGFLYVGLHFLGTGAALVWVHHRRPQAFAQLRTTLIVSTALALTGYVLYPAAPPRLAGMGFSDTVTSHTGLDLSSDVLGSLYNPIAAVPSLHFGYALAVGVALVRIASTRGLRLAAALYPGLMLLVIVGTGNHFFFDAAAGGLVTAAGWWVASRVAAPAPTPRPAAARLRTA